MSANTLPADHNVAPDQAPSRPSRTRHGVVVFAILLAVICYTDRVIIAQAAPEVQHDLGLSEVQMGWVFLVFTWAYALFEIPGGWMGDRWGARKVLLRVVTCWSFFTAATGWAWNYATLLVYRFLFGASQAGCFPNLSKAFATWLPGRERVRAQGWMWFSARWGGAITPLLVAALLQVTPWRMVFLLFGVVGLAWAVAFAWWYRDRPGDHPAVNAAELALLPNLPARLESREKVPWALFLRSRAVWLLWLQYFLLSFSWWFYITWLPTYLKEGRGYQLPGQKWAAALLAGLPLFCGGIGCLLSGLFFLPGLVRVLGSSAVARRGVGAGGLLAAALLLLVSVQCRSPLAAMLAMGLASFSGDLTIPAAWGASMDLGGRYVGIVSGGMNMCGAAGGGLGALCIGYLLRWTEHNWDVAIAVLAATYFLGSLCWLKLDPVTPVAVGPDDATEGRAT